MPIKAILILIGSAFLANGPSHADGNGMPARDQSSYAKLEVRGTLIHEGAAYFIQTQDSIFSDVKLLVRLDRSEDKNRFVDRHLAALEGKQVVAHGFLDCRQVGKEEGVIHLYLRSETQVRAAGEN